MNNKHFVFSFTTALFLLLLSATISMASPHDEQAITITLSNNVVKEAIAKTLPLQFPINSGTIAGSVSIDKIEGLQFRKNALSAHVTLTGHDIQIVTSIAGRDIRLKAGTLTTGFQCDANLRFDASTQTLFIKPVITRLSSTDQNVTDVASAITLLFNNRELPLPMEKLHPIVADTGNKLLTVSMKIASLELGPKNVLLGIIPTIKTVRK